MNDHPTTPTPPSGDLPPDADAPFPAADDPFAARYAELRRLGWQPSVAFLRAYKEQFARQTRAERAWIDTDDTTTPDGGAL